MKYTLINWNWIWIFSGYWYPVLHWNSLVILQSKNTLQMSLFLCVQARKRMSVSYCVRKWQLQKCVATGMYACMSSQNQCDMVHRRGWVTFDLQCQNQTHRKTKTREASTRFHLDCIRKIYECVFTLTIRSKQRLSKPRHFYYTVWQ